MKILYFILVILIIIVSSLYSDTNSIKFIFVINTSSGTTASTDYKYNATIGEPASDTIPSSSLYKYYIGSFYTINSQDININSTAQYNFLDNVYCYPNPAPDPQDDNNVYFHYYLNSNADVEIVVFTFSGEIVFKKKIYAGEIGGLAGRNGQNFELNWDISKIASDIYFYLIKTKDLTGKDIIKKGKIAVIK